MTRADRERWDAKYRQRELASEASSSLVALERFVPAGGRALDVAGGSGRNALWLAQRGLDVTLVDVSPIGAAMAEQRASQLGVALRAVVVDVDTEPLPTGPFDLIVDTYFLSRRLFVQLADRMSVGGTLIFIHPTRTNLQQHSKPPAAFLLDDDELPSLVTAAGLHQVHYWQGWTCDGRHEAQLVARKR